MQVPITLEHEAAALCGKLGADYGRDREIRAIVLEAQRKLEALAWNRYAARMTRKSAHRAFVRRQRSLAARRSGTRWAVPHA